MPGLLAKSAGNARRQNHPRQLRMEIVILKLGRLGTVPRRGGRQTLSWRHLTLPLMAVQNGLANELSYYLLPGVFRS